MSPTPPHDRLPSKQAIRILLGVTVLAVLVLAGSIWIILPEEQESPPIAQFEWEYDGDELTATHNGGDGMPADRLSVRGDGITNSGDPVSESGQYPADATITYRDQIVIGTGYYQWTTDSASPPIRLVWTSQDGERAVTIAKWQGPGG